MGGVISSLQKSVTRVIPKKKPNPRRLLKVADSGDADSLYRKIARGYDPNSRDKKSLETPLHKAASKGHLDVIRVLLSRNVEVDVTDKVNRTPLHFAAQNGHVEAIELLMQQGSPSCKVSINAQDQDGQTPLHLAAAGGHLEAVKKLQQCGANSDIRDKNGKTAADIAKNSEVGQLLGGVGEPTTTVSQPLATDPTIDTTATEQKPTATQLDTEATLEPVQPVVVSEAPAHISMPVGKSSDSVVRETNATSVHPSIATKIPVVEAPVSNINSNVGLPVLGTAEVTPAEAAAAAVIAVDQASGVHDQSSIETVTHTQPVANSIPSLDAAELKPLSAPAPVSLVAEQPSTVQYSDESFPAQQAIAPKVEAERVPVKPPMFETRPAAPAKSSGGPDPLDNNYTTSAVTTTF